MDDIETNPREAVPPPAAGYAAQPWSAEKPRAGGWWRRRNPQGYDKIVLITEEDEGLFVLTIYGDARWLEDYPAEGWWSGPVEFPDAPDAETRHTDKMSH